MRSFLALLKKDIKGYFDQPTGYILLIIFAAISAYLFFRTALVNGDASLRPLFDWMPWILTIFVPAATMRLIAEEQRDGTLEILFTQPIRGWNVLIAKFLVGLIFVSTGVIFTIGIPLALMTAGKLDLGAIFAQYLGTLFLTAAFVSIGLFTSSLTQNQIVAFVLGLSTILFLMVIGLPIVTLAFPSGIAVLLQDLSPITHFSSMERGVLDLKDVLYFAALVSTFFSATYLMIRGKSLSHRAPLYRNLQLGVAGLVIISILIGWFGRDLQGRWDLTEGKLYTLSPATESILSNLDDIVNIKLFASQNAPVQLALITREVNDLLDDMSARSNGKLRIIRHFPDVNQKDEIEADHSFVPPVSMPLETQGELGIKIGYLGMGMTYSNRQEVIPFIENIDGLEYQIVSNIFRMAQKKPKTIGILYGHGEKRRDSHLQSFRDQLERHHIVEELNDAQAEVLAFLGEVDVLVVAGPREFIDLEVLNGIDEFISDGGKALFMIDTVDINQQRLMVDEIEYSLADYLEQYGVFVGTNIVFDSQSNEILTFGDRGRPLQLPYPYWARVFSSDPVIAGGVTSMMFPWASSIVVDAPSDKDVEVQATTIIETTQFGAVDESFTNLGVQSPVFNEVAFENLGPKQLAVAITGTRPPPLGYYRGEELTQTTEKDPDEKIFRIIVTGDSDWITESIVGHYPENLAIGVNFINWLTQEDELAAIRAKGSSIRPLLFNSPTHRNIVQYSNIIGVPSIFVLIGLLRYIVRRNLTRKEYRREG